MSNLSINGRSYRARLMRIVSADIRFVPRKEGEPVLITELLFTDPNATVLASSTHILDSNLETGRWRIGTRWGMDHIRQLIRAVGVASWAAIQGARVEVLFMDGSRRVHGLRGLNGEEPLVFDDHFRDLQQTP